ncbi:MAG: hypothetical protein R3240_05575 [Gammaproteobacteria bacterium]|nr:hypothetical protein [Gammaproteobacteria bacterium]
MFSALVLTNILLLLALLRLANSSNLLFLRGSALNPITFIAILNLFFMLDFIGLHLDPVVDLYEEPFPVNEGDINLGYFFYLCCLTFAIAGIAAALNNASPTPDKFALHINNASTQHSDIAFRLVMLIGLIATGFLLLSFNDLMAGNVTRQNFFTDNKLLNIAFSAIPTALAFYMRDKNPMASKTIAAVLLCTLIIFATGSRGAVILIVIIFAYTINTRLRSIPTLLYFIAIPAVAGMLLSVRYFFRTSMQYDTLGSFIEDKGGLFSLFFNTAEISMAEIIVTIVKWGDYVARYPFESFIGGLMYPLPRSIFTFKPLGAGGAFTEEFSPVRWELTRSEIVTTGFGDLYLQFGFIGTLIFMFLLAYAWTRLVKASLSVSGSNSIVLIPFLMWWAYLFLRSGIFNMAGAIWSFMLVVVIIKLIGLFQFKMKDSPS